MAKKVYTIEIEYNEQPSEYKPVCIEVKYHRGAKHVVADFAGNKLKPLLNQIASYIFEAEQL